MGGLSTPYATTPMNSRTGMTIGGTRYFMRFPRLKRTRLAAPAGNAGAWSTPGHNMLKRVAAPRARQASNIMACQ
jgi:hypothetical protein